MKYLTKSWYERLQKIDMNLLIEITEKAETFSEVYYKKIYQEEERKWIELQKAIGNIKSKNKEIDISDNIVNKNKEKFKNIQEEIIKKLEKKLPDYILEKVADIRVLALGKASSIVKKELDEYCGEQKAIVDKAINEYNQYYNDNLKKYENSFIKDFNFHDCEIISFKKQEKNVVIMLDTTNNYLVEIKQIILKNCEIIKEEDNICKARWLYNEIYIKDNGYEIHVLLADSKGVLIDFIVHTDDVIYVY